MQKNIDDIAFKGENNKFIYTYIIRYDNNDYYYGYHTTKNLNDNYSGSNTQKSKGNLLSRTILKFHKTINDAGKHEKQLINDLWKTDKNCLNNCPGGLIGGWQLLPKELLDEYRRKNLNDLRENVENYKLISQKGGKKGALVSHAEKTHEGKSLMTANANKNRTGKIKIRKDWNLVTEDDKKLFPRINKRIENEYEFASAMCLPEQLEELLNNNWKKYVSKTKGKKIHSKESKEKISKNCSKTLKGRNFTDEHKENISKSRKKYLQNKEIKNESTTDK